VLQIALLTGLFKPLLWGFGQEIQVSDRSVAPVAQHSFEKADLHCVAEIEDAEAIGGEAPPRIAEAAQRLA
jgi:hypothetical protein